MLWYKPIIIGTIVIANAAGADKTPIATIVVQPTPIKISLVTSAMLDNKLMPSICTFFVLCESLMFSLFAIDCPIFMYSLKVLTCPYTDKTVEVVLPPTCIVDL